MENFFNTGTQSHHSTPLNVQYDDLKDHYKQIFIEAAESIRREIEKFKPENPCTLCLVKNHGRDNLRNKIFGAIRRLRRRCEFQ
jgi:hypothetical protein